ncbi:murein transglycosylase A [Aromatoleum aromaticum]|nr:murein transglycosylase A [Aromatoleum aromaticum]NMG56365.1 murein transglycosylase [Aromatoleum aromaticum]
MKPRASLSPIRALLAVAMLGLLSACGTRPPSMTTSSATAPVVRACPPAQACPACQACPGGVPAAVLPPPAPADPLQRIDWSELPGWGEDDHARAWPALRESCNAIARQPQWQATCEAARALGDAPTAALVRRFLEAHLEPWAIVNPDGTREGLITGYYEPLIRGSRTRSERYPWPVHGVPSDMLTVDFGNLYPDLKNLRLRGRIVGNKVVPYWTRADIERMQDRAPAPTLLWASDPIDLFFLQVQGSGRVELPDGTKVRIGYADQNGHPYQSIGRWLVAQGELPIEKASMEGIKTWAHANPQRLSEMLNTNPSYVFFRELPARGGGPIGALGVPLTDERSIAVDPRTVPLGAPVYLSTTWPLSDRPLQRLMFAQDTGGAIKGAVRADFFWGFGSEAGVQAGRMRQQGQLWVLLPRSSRP